MINSDDDINPIHIKLPKLTGSIEILGKIKYMSFILKTWIYELKNNEVRSNVTGFTKKDFGIEVITKNKYKIKKIYIPMEM